MVIKNARILKILTKKGRKLMSDKFYNLGFLENQESKLQIIGFLKIEQSVEEGNLVILPDEFFTKFPNFNSKIKFWKIKRKVIYISPHIENTGRSSVFELGGITLILVPDEDGEGFLKKLI